MTETNTRQESRKSTREMLLDAAESAVLEKGFSATSIDELIAAVGITKGGFFYHFWSVTSSGKTSCSTSFSVAPTN